MVDYLCINPKNKTAYFRNFHSHEPEQRTIIEHEHPFQTHYKQLGTHCDYDTCTFSDEDKKLLYRLFGSHNSFDQNMKFLSNAGILYTKIELMNLKDVMNYAKENAIGHFMSLNSFKNYSDVNCMTGHYSLLMHNHIRAIEKK